MKRIHLVFAALLFSVFGNTLFGFNGLQRFSDEFYAAQKCFYNEAKKKYPKLVKEKAYPEVPIRGAITKEELDKIQALMDPFEARRCFSNEVNTYPEQLYPEIFSFLYNHPALAVSSSNKVKFEALEKYFSGFDYLFCSDPYHYFHPDVKTNPCPVVFCYSDDKKSQLNLNISNASKINLNLLINTGLLVNKMQVNGKNPLSLKSNSSQSLKFTVDLAKLKSDSSFRVLQLVMNDPSQPKIKLMASVVLLPSKQFLKLPVQFFDLKYTYTSHLKNIDLYTDRTSGPERCSGSNCSGELKIPQQQHNRYYHHYAFGDAAKVQFNFSSSGPALYSTTRTYFEFELNELGEIQGKARDCPGPVPGSSGPCPPETANNGKQLYGSRKIEFAFMVPETKTADFFLQIDVDDLRTNKGQDATLSWLENKKILLIVYDASGKQVLKEIMKQQSLKTGIQALQAGKYTVALYPMSEDSNKQNPSFEINHLNQSSKARFDFRLKGKLMLKVI